MQLFISHASEDKISFVRPLAEALKAGGFKVWFDEYEMTLGDSLLKKITAGLSASDYGVVVLSPDFFRKKWPQAELDGLFSLETTTRKMILPVWKDIDQSGVAAFSPILAGRLAVLAANGIDRVVDEIRRAVGVSERRLEISRLGGASMKLKKADTLRKARDVANALLQTEKGVALINTEFLKVCSILEAEINKAVSGFVFNLVGSRFGIVGPYGINLAIVLTRIDRSSAANAELCCDFHEFEIIQFGGMRGQRWDMILRYKPYFDGASSVVWTDPSARESVTTSEQLIATTIEQLASLIEQKSQTKR